MKGLWRQPFGHGDPHEAYAPPLDPSCWAGWRDSRRVPDDVGYGAVAAYAGPPEMPPGNGMKVLVLGAGIAGMVLGWELGRAGYDCTILEARTRPGGRNWSLRAGDLVEETDSVQRVRWETGEHLYFNPGPARLPWHHDGILSYCRLLGVKLEMMCNENRGAWLQDDAAFGGERQRNRAVVHDTRGYVTELAAKAVDKGLLDHPPSMEDAERMRSFLRFYGALDRDLVYRGAARLDDEEDAANRPKPLDFAQIIRSDFWQGRMMFGEFPNQAPTMLQPVGGMARIGEAFGRKLWGVITYGAAVTQIRRTESGARVTWKDAQGAEHAAEAPIVVCTIPFPALRGVETDFAPATRAAITGLEYIPAAKVAFLAERRFWECDEGIYGGVSWTSRDITQVWYPSAGLQARKGILVAAYIWSSKLGEAFAAKPLDKRLEDALEDLECLHPGQRTALRKGISVSWKKIPYNGGAWAEWTRSARQESYPTLRTGDGPVLFAGEHISDMPGWQEGAVRSAHYAMLRIAERAQARKT
ncbi:MAG: FAD-dependent oxidoreductase [Acetobacteraceae bacterium]|nr:FAD-dependent oxidoreductase [Acetobacteraceae bacterium]